jgi:putative ABC transport system permease protein
LTIFLSSIAAISLIVGGIGIMNIILVSVAERMREIGLRRAVGATRKDILFQFLFESIVLTVLGGIIGIVLGLSLSFLSGIIISKFLKVDWISTIPFLAIVLGFFVSGFIGLVFGIYPARRASNLSPIEALKYE